MRPCRLALPLLALACMGPAAEPTAPDPAGSAGPGGGPAAARPAGDASLEIERLDLDPGCDGLVPAAAPEPVHVRLEVGDGEACVGGVSDGTGAVALGVRDVAGAVTWRVHGRDGAPAGAFAAEWPLLSQPSGWHALEVSRPPFGADPTVHLVAVAPAGDVVRRERVTPDPAVAVGPRWSLASDPAGGSAVAVRATYVGGNHWSEVRVHRFDAAGAPRWPGGARALTVGSAREPAYLGAGLPTGGDLLLLSQRSAFVDVTWLEPDASAAGGSVMQEPAAAVVGDGPSHAIELAPLLDGSVALRADGTWRRTYAPRAAASDALPAWLAGRADRALRLAPGGAGYVLLPPPGRAAPDCATHVELVSRAGRTCARITIREAGATCTIRDVDQGRDGTLVAQSAADACTIRWWPGLLAP
ncbi:MAG TPA: hypothetical protein VFL83_20420 [Anaeromyxobacter sp.]|nr:hypothetical protein [Anaeromyxobacter sp.]